MTSSFELQPLSMFPFALSSLPLIDSFSISQLSGKLLTIFWFSFLFQSFLGIFAIIPIYAACFIKILAYITTFLTQITLNSMDKVQIFGKHLLIIWCSNIRIRTNQFDTEINHAFIKFSLRQIFRCLDREFIMRMNHAHIHSNVTLIHCLQMFRPTKLKVLLLFHIFFISSRLFNANKNTRLPIHTYTLAHMHATQCL